MLTPSKFSHARTPTQHGLAACLLLACALVGLGQDPDQIYRLPPPNSSRSMEPQPVEKQQGEILPQEDLPGDTLDLGGSPSAGDFPPLPPDPYAAEQEELPPLDEELMLHGGSYLYQPEGDRLGWPSKDSKSHYDYLREPEDFLAPEPLTVFTEFLGTGPIHYFAKPGRYAIEPRFVAYGRYDLFGFAFEEDGVRRDGVGHNLLVELDLRLTGTERFHVQFRPLGEGNTGGSFYLFSDPEGYVDNSEIEPTRYWFEAELHSLIGPNHDPFGALDWNFVVGKFPFFLHNTLLLNDEFVGFVASKNTWFIGNTSNLNVQLFYGFADVDAFETADGQLAGIHGSLDYKRQFYELTYALVRHDFDSTQDTHYAAVSRTEQYGPLSLAARAMFKWGDQGGTGDGQLFVLESNWTRAYEKNCLDVSYSVTYCNAFFASAGWRAISSGNFNRLRTSFEVSPLLRITTVPPTEDTWGVSLGTQFFRHHEDESIIPEIAVEGPDGDLVYGFGLRYLRKTGKRTFLELLGFYNHSSVDVYNRHGIFVSHNWLF